MQNNEYNYFWVFLFRRKEVGCWGWGVGRSGGGYKGDFNSCMISDMQDYRVSNVKDFMYAGGY